ncbi:MAG: sugar transferase [Clostridia bacterium]|nr:sugar transferase [Clostridia bacterium]
MVKLKGRKIPLGDGVRRSLRVRLYPLGKRCLDFVLAAFLLLAATPMFFFVAFGIRVTSCGPVLFRQVRVGRRLEPFLLYKFRTMSCRAPHDVATADMPARYITRFGRFLRKTSLDELPQLINVLRGDMSLLGPRPVVLSEVELIASRAARGVYTVRPGISGLAQISGRDLLSPEEKARLDSEYVQQMSFLRDVRLFLSTCLAVFSRRDIREGNIS